VWHLQFVLSLSKELTERTQDAIKTLAPVEEEREDSPTQTYPERYRSLAMQALQRCEISVGRFAEYLGISRQKAMHYMPQGALNYEEIQVPFA
jgi:DNA-binding NtrC family response regulator